MDIYHIFCIHSSVEGYLGSFQLLAIIDRAAMNIMEHVSLLHAGEYSGYMPGSGIEESSGSEVPSFRRNRKNFLLPGQHLIQELVELTSTIRLK